MKKDIETKADIQIFVDAFYAKMPTDDLVGHVFMDVAHVDFSKHLPKMYDFWEMLLMDGKNYQGAPMRPHLEINQKIQLTPAHFARWLPVILTFRTKSSYYHPSIILIPEGSCHASIFSIPNASS